MVTEESQSLRDRLARKIAANPTIKTAMLAETLGVSEAELFSNWPDDSVREVPAVRLEELLHALVPLGELYVICRNGAAVMEVSSAIASFSRSGPWLNVMGPGLHLHLRPQQVARIFRVVKKGNSPGESSVSLQLFDPAGNAALKFFLLEGKCLTAGSDYAELSARFPG